MKKVQLVSNAQTIRKLLPEQAHKIRSYIMSAEYPVDPALCTTKFGKWLAENTGTTRFDDDLSILNIELNVTEEELWFKQTAKAMSDARIRSAEHAELITNRIKAELDYRAEVRRMYGSTMYDFRTVQFQWPIFDLNDVQTVEEYFDKCAGMIRAMRPRNVSYFVGEKIPESLLESMRK